VEVYAETARVCTSYLQQPQQRCLGCMSKSRRRMPLPLQAIEAPSAPLFQSIVQPDGGAQEIHDRMRMSAPSAGNARTDKPSRILTNEAEYKVHTPGEESTYAGMWVQVEYKEAHMPSNSVHAARRFARRARRCRPEGAF